jgi:hypothetical protein
MMKERMTYAEERGRMKEVGVEIRKRYGRRRGRGRGRGSGSGRRGRRRV